MLFCPSTEVCHLLSKQRVQDPRTSFRAKATAEELPSLLCKGRCDPTHSSKTHEICCHSRHPPACKLEVLCQESHRKELLCSRPKKDSIRQEFESRALQAFIKCSGVLVSKMPLTNPALQAFSVLDRKTRGTTAVSITFPHYLAFCHL